METNQRWVTVYIRGIPRKKWRPYLSQGQRGTVASTGRILLVDSDRVVAAK